ncbi:MAG: NAD(P)/FAD-dependent oxidoreductase, partial [Opitutales bacterium]|nr:NAD(P)/FAD-dependent oxidoreductase [Opitutales bacterium]
PPYKVRRGGGGGVGGGAPPPGGARAAAPGAEITVYEREPKILAWMARLGDAPAFLGWADDDPGAFLAAMRKSVEAFAGLFFMRVPGSAAKAWWAAQDIETRAEGNALLSARPAREVAAALRDRLREADINALVNHTAEEAVFAADGSARLWFTGHPVAEAGSLLFAVGGGPNRALSIARDHGHTDELFVPGCFAFRVADPRLKGLPGTELPAARVEAFAGHPPKPLGSGEGALRITGRGLEGPAVLAASAAGAAALAAREYRFSVSINWIARLAGTEVTRSLREHALAFGKRSVHTDPLFDLPPKLWVRLAKAARIGGDLTWTSCPPRKLNALVGQLTHARFKVAGYFLDTRERTWRGGLHMAEFDPPTLESRRRPGLYAAGEVLHYLGDPGPAHTHATLATALTAGPAAARAR